MQVNHTKEKKTTKMVQDILAFQDLIRSIDDTNIVIGGMHALKLNGLKMNREPNDLDLIIYNPTTKQQDVIKSIKLFETSRPNLTYFTDTHQTNKGQKSYKFEKNGFVLDILIEDKETPKNLLLYKLASFDLRIQSVSNVIDAKNSYRHTEHGRAHGVFGPEYVREKDMIDLFDLKNSNFNPK